MTERYFNLKDAADYIQKTHDIVYRIEAQIESVTYEISDRSEAITGEDNSRLADELLLEIYNDSVKLQVILLRESRLEKMFTADYGKDFFIKLENRTDKIYHLCQYLSKRHDIKADHDASKTNKIIMFLTSIMVYTYILKIPPYVLNNISIQIDTFIVSVVLFYAIFIYSKPQKSVNCNEGEINKAP